ncbi:MAG: polymer-forming cytoskeletal protein [Vulcanimicrobiota bacterium]
MQTKAENLRVASLTARNSLTLVLSRLDDNRDWGKDGDSIRWNDEVSGGAVGRVKFKKSDDSTATEEPAALVVGPEPSESSLEPLDEQLYSVNNLGGQNSVRGYNGLVVPPNSVLVVAVGEFRGTRQVAYQIVQGSPQPYSLASSGPLEVRGDTLVAGLESTLQAVSLGANPELEDLEEAGLVSNDDGLEAIKLDGNIQIVGDVEARGEIQTSPQVQILNGEMKKLDSPKDFPEIDFDSYDPLGNPADPSDDRPTLRERTEAVVTDALDSPLYGFQRFPGSVSFPDGLKLDGSAIYVDGDLTLDGPLEGTGALIVRGNVNLRGGAQLDADVMAAILCEGNLVVNGNAGQPSTFQGLLYAEGDLELSNTRVVGTAIAAGSASGVPSNLLVKDSTIIATPDSSDFRIVVKGFASQGPGGLGGIDAGGGSSGNGWDILEPNPADLLVQNPDGSSTFVWDPSQLKIRVQQADGSWKIINTAEEASAAGLASGELDSLEIAYDKLIDIWEDRIDQLQAHHAQELVDILGFDLNEFLKVSSRLKAKRVFYVD